MQSWLGNVKLKSFIAFEKVARILSQHGAPEEVLTKYIKLVDDNEEKFNLCKEFRLHHLAIDVSDLFKY